MWRIVQCTAALHHAVPPPRRLSDAVVVRDDGQPLRHRGLADELLDQVVGLVIVDRERDMDALVVDFVGQAGRGVPSVEDHGDLGRAVAAALVQQLQQAPPGLP